MLEDEAATPANNRAARVDALAAGGEAFPVPAGRSGQLGTIRVDDTSAAHTPVMAASRISASEPAGDIVAPSQDETEDYDGIGFEPAPQSIPHDVMLAGLLAASDPGRFPVRISSEQVVSASEQAARHAGTGGAIPATVADMPAAAPLSDPWLQGVSRLQAMEALPGFSPGEWAAVQAGCDMVAQRADELRTLGWSAADCFGVDPRTPDAVHAWGLGLLVGSSDLVELTARTATIARPNGVTHTYYRRPCAWAVPVWEVGG